MCQHLPDVPGEQTQQLVFDGREADLLSVQTDAAGGIVDAQGAVSEDGRGGIGRRGIEPPQRDPQAGQKLRNRKRFCQIVIRAGIQGVDLIGILAAGADDDDGHVRPGAYPADDLDAVQVRQTEIQQDDVRIVCGGGDHSGLTGLGGEIAIPLRLQRDGDQVLNRKIVFHDQNQCFIH